MPKKTSVNWKALTDKAAALIKAEQKTDYVFLRQKLGVGVGTIAKVLKRLEAKGIVRRGKGRRWTVIVNPDGSPKSGQDVPQKRRFRKVRRGKGARATSPPSGVLTDKAKIEFVKQLADAAVGRSAQILGEVVLDLKLVSDNRKLLDALKG